MRRRPSSEPVLAGSLLPRLLGDLGLEASARVARIAEGWSEALGPRLAAHSRPLALRGEELEVGVESSVWCQELQLLLPEMLAALREALGEDAPAALRLRLDSRPARLAGRPTREDPGRGER